MAGIDVFYSLGGEKNMKLLGVPVGLIVLVVGLLVPLLWADALLMAKLDGTQQAFVGYKEACAVFNQITPEEVATPSAAVGPTAAKAVLGPTGVGKAVEQ